MRHLFLHCTDFCTFSPCPRTPPINIVCTSHSKRVDKFIVKSNITFNKLQDFETGHQTPEYFPHKEWETSRLLLENKYHFSANVVFTKPPLRELLLLWHLLCAQVVLCVSVDRSQSLFNFVPQEKNLTVKLAQPVFRKTYKSIISHVAWNNLDTPLSLFSESIAIHNHNRQE